MSARLTVLCLALALAIALCGCGGDGGGQGGRMGALRFSATFPAPPVAGQIAPQYIPAGTGSLVVTIADADTGTPKCDPVVIDSPTGGGTVDVNVKDLAPGKVKVRVEAHRDAGGKGPVWCVGETQTDIVAGFTADVSITLGTVPVDITFDAPSRIAVGGVATAYVSATDVDGNTALGDWEWWSEDNAIAGVDASGELSGVARGTTKIWVKDKLSGNSASFDLEVYPDIDRVEIELVGTPYPPIGYGPSGTTPSFAYLTEGQSQDVTVKCYDGETEITDVPITFDCSDPTKVGVTQESTGSPNATLEGLNWGYGIIVTASQPYTTATGQIQVQVMMAYGG